MAHQQKDTLETQFQPSNAHFLKDTVQGGETKTVKRHPRARDPGQMKEMGQAVWPHGGPGCAQRCTKHSTHIPLLGSGCGVLQGR